MIDKNVDTAPIATGSANGDPGHVDGENVRFPLVPRAPVVPLTIEQLKAVMPARQKANITPALVAEINKIAIEPEYRELYQENLISFTSVLNDPNSTLPGYLKAVRYVGYKVMGMSNQESWMRTFPDRYQRLVLEKAPDNYLRSLVCAYNKGLLVNKILEQTLVPTWILNADKFQKAINVQAELMVSSSSDNVRTEAANSLLTHLKQPLAAKVEIDIGIKEDRSITLLKDAILQLSKTQHAAIRDGVSAQDIAESDIIDVESERIE